MNKIIDLHIHSNYSEDADLSIDEIFESVQSASISAISITDHDSAASIEKAKIAVKKYSIEYIPGIEITTVFHIDNSQQHILGYYIDNKNSKLLSCLEKIADYRREITAKRINELKRLNFSINENKIQEMTGNKPPTAVSIIVELLDNKENLTDKRLYDYLYGTKKENKIASFYKDYFTENGLAYVPFKSISSQEGINIIKKAGGIPILAHPIFLKNKEWLNIMKDMGIAGLEAVSTYHNQKDVEFYLQYANENNLLITAGSDFHGTTAKPKVKLGEQEGMAYSYFEKLSEFHQKISIN